MTANSVRRVRVHVPAKDGWPESVRGVGSEVVCVVCGARLKGRTHAEARKALRFHTLDRHATNPPRRPGFDQGVPLHRLDGCA